MKPYVVSWTIEIDADSPEQAVREARKVMLDPQSLATVFHVVDEDGNTRQIDAALLEKT